MDADLKKKMWDGLKGPLIFFAWLGIQIGGGYAFDATMPHGFGNAIFGLQILGAIVAGGFFAMGLPTALDPSTLVVVSGRGRGSPNVWTTWPRKKGLRLTSIGLAITFVVNVGGYIVDRAAGVPRRHRLTAQRAIDDWMRRPPPELATCLAKLYATERSTCQVTVNVRVDGASLTIQTDEVTCPGSTPIATCVRGMAPAHLPFDDLEERASLAYAWGGTEVQLTAELRGLGGLPPAERE